MDKNIFTPKENSSGDDALLKAKREALKKKLQECKKTTKQSNTSAAEDKTSVTEDTSQISLPQEDYSQSDINNISDDECINDIKGWNWGAFSLNWIWGLFNGVYWPLALIILSFIPYVGILLTFLISIELGVKGNELAWKAKSWSSVDEFKRVQRKWSIAGICVFVINIFIIIIYILGIISIVLG